MVAVGVGVGVDWCGGGIGRGMVVAKVVEISGITVTSMLVKCYLSLEIEWQSQMRQKNFAMELQSFVCHEYRSFGLAACASLESKNEVCLLCEVNPKQIPAFDFICASLESILAIEDTWERERSGFAEEKVWGDIPVVTGFLGAGKKTFWGS
ncbi:hypothetical protein Tco_1104410 [Tanacetum coccineum]